MWIVKLRCDDCGLMSEAEYDLGEDSCLSVIEDMEPSGFTYGEIPDYGPGHMCPDCTEKSKEKKSDDD